MPTERDTTYDSGDQGGESPCFMCLLAEDGQLPDQRDAISTQDDENPTAAPSLRPATRRHSRTPAATPYPSPPL